MTADKMVAVTLWMCLKTPPRNALCQIRVGISLQPNTTMGYPYYLSSHDADTVVGIHGLPGEAPAIGRCQLFALLPPSVALPFEPCQIVMDQCQ